MQVKPIDEYQLRSNFKVLREGELEAKAHVNTTLDLSKPNIIHGTKNKEEKIYGTKN